MGNLLVSSVQTAAVHQRGSAKAAHGRESHTTDKLLRRASRQNRPVPVTNKTL